jgi:Ulp1 family protease
MGLANFYDLTGTSLFPQVKTITTYDSCSHLNQARLDNVRQFLNDEYGAHGVVFPETQWKTVDSGRTCPAQKNGSDCGPFTCIRADYVALGLVPDYAQVDIPSFRRGICLSILSGSVI